MEQTVPKGVGNGFELSGRMFFQHSLPLSKGQRRHSLYRSGRLILHPFINKNPYLEKQISKGFHFQV